MKRIILVSIVFSVIVALTIIFVPGMFNKPAPSLDTKTHSFETAGFYGRGDYAGELLESDTIRTNVTTGTGGEIFSQSIKFRGAACQRTDGLGRIFFDGARVTEPDTYYRVTVNGIERFRHNIELGNSAVLPNCVMFPEKEYVMMGQTLGSVKVELFAYVFEFARGAGAYSLLASDQAKLV